MKLNITFCCLLLAGIEIFAVNPMAENKVQLSVSPNQSNQSNLIYLNEERLEKVKDLKVEE
jgi:hypothetical protein